MGDDLVKGYLYRHTRSDRDEVFYVGIGITKNYGRDYSKSHRNRFWHNVASKTNYNVNIVLNNIPYNVLLEKEKEFIALYGRRNINTGTLVNLTDGGEGVLGCIKPHGGKGKSWNDICKNPEQVRINRENRSLPYIIKVEEPDGNSYDVYCDNIPDFNKKLKITSKYLTGVLKYGKRVIIQRRKNTTKHSTKHSLKVGSILSYVPVVRDKQIFEHPKPPTGNRCRPFTIIISEPNKDDYEIYCGNNKDFFKKIGKDTRSIKSLKNNKIVTIEQVRVDSNHNFPVGTQIKMKNI